MATLNMSGPFSLTNEEIDSRVKKQVPGNYALGRTLESGKFSVAYVGRSDNDLNQRLHQHVGEYPQFKFSYASSAREAYVKECQNWHDFTPKDNTNHPASPKGITIKCPVCNS